MITKEEFKKEIQDALEGAFSGVSEKAKQEKVTEILETAQTTISELLQSVESKDGELAKSEDEKKALQEKVDELVSKAQKLEEQLAAREAELKELDEKRVSADNRAVAAETELNQIALDRALDKRVSELAEAKVLKSGDKMEVQKSKVRTMSDEEFSSYKEELIEMRASLEESLKESATTTDDEEEEVETVEVAPAAISEENASLAAINVENTETATLKSKYQDLSAALAKKMRKE